MKHRFAPSYTAWQTKTAVASRINTNADQTLPSFSITTQPSTIYTNTIDDSVM
jgi:hypothetical protein